MLTFSHAIWGWWELLSQVSHPCTRALNIYSYYVAWIASFFGDIPFCRDQKTSHFSPLVLHYQHEQVPATFSKSKFPSLQMQKSCTSNRHPKHIYVGVRSVLCTLNLAATLLDWLHSLSTYVCYVYAPKYAGHTSRWQFCKKQFWRYCVI